MDQQLKIPSIAFLVFFATILVYDFHTVSFQLEGKHLSISMLLKSLNEFSTSTKIIEAIAVVGIVVSAWHVQTKTLFFIIPPALMTLAYSIPVFRIQGKKKRLCDFPLVKIFLLSVTWCMITVTLPIVENNGFIFSNSSLFLFAERLLFIFSICIPFEIRDMENEKKRGIVTLPLRMGVNRSKFAGILSLFLFILILFIHRNDSSVTAAFSFVLPLTISAVVASFLVFFSHQRRSPFYFHVFIDGTMHLQLILLILFNCCR